MEQSVNISHLTGINDPTGDFSCFERDYALSRLRPGMSYRQEISDYRWRFDGITVILALNGISTININFEEIHVRPNSMIVTGPNAIVSTTDVDWDNIEAYMLFVSKEFLLDINLDVNVIDTRQMARHHHPVLELTAEESDLLHRYLKLLHLNAKEREANLYMKSIARNLVSALLYQLMEIHASHTAAENAGDSGPTKSRRLGYVRDFMELVRHHYIRERSVGFYADKLYISAKYLSLIIKESTGKSAAQWIDEYVILEAKNMLRFSGKNIQQIAYELNFSNQSSFGKYFKHLTGMSPSAFQRS